MWNNVSVQHWRECPHCDKCFAMRSLLLIPCLSQVTRSNSVIPQYNSYLKRFELKKVTEETKWSWGEGNIEIYSYLVVVFFTNIWKPFFFSGQRKWCCIWVWYQIWASKSGVTYAVHATWQSVWPQSYSSMVFVKLASKKRATQRYWTMLVNSGTAEINTYNQCFSNWNKIIF